MWGEKGTKEKYGKEHENTNFFARNVNGREKW